MSWDLRFNEPIVLANGLQLRSLRDAGTYITSLPPGEYEASEWQTAMHVLLEAADHAGPVSFARLGMAQALHRREESVFDPSRKQPNWRKAGSR
jgi:hypothetical protein